MTVPFSVSVPMICGYLDDFISYYEDYSKYLSDMSPYIRQSVESAIKNVICQQLKYVISNSQIKKNDNPNQPNSINTTNHHNNNDTHNKQTNHYNLIISNSGIDRKLEIGELAQLAVNASYLEKSCTFFERELATDDQINFNEDGGDKVGILSDNKMNGNDGIIQIPKMHQARDALKSVMSQCVDALFERLGIEVELILNNYMPKINWMSDKINNNN